MSPRPMPYSQSRRQHRRPTWCASSWSSALIPGSRSGISAVGRLIYQLGRQGDRRTIAGEPPLRVFLGYVDGVSIAVDGTPLQIPAERRLGNTARFTIPLDAAPSSRR